MCNRRHLIPPGILLRCLVALSRSLAVYLYSASGSLFTEDVLLNPYGKKLILASKEWEFPRPKAHAASRS